jgi:hypothetical protein
MGSHYLAWCLSRSPHGPVVRDRRAGVSEKWGKNQGKQEQLPKEGMYLNSLFWLLLPCFPCTWTQLMSLQGVYLVPGRVKMTVMTKGGKVGLSCNFRPKAKVVDPLFDTSWWKITESKKHGSSLLACGNPGSWDPKPYLVCRTARSWATNETPSHHAASSFFW